jgi:transcriptional regulator with XRE-family HTH domain
MATNNERSPGEFFRTVRESSETSLRQATQRAGLPTNGGYLSQLEIGHVTNPPIRKLPSLAAAYDISIETILLVYGIEVGSIDEVDADPSVLAIKHLLSELSPKNMERLLGFAQFLVAQDKAS